MNKPPLVSIIFVYYNTPAEIIDCLNSIKKAVAGYSYEVIIIDNNSPISVPAEALKTFAIKLISNKTNVGYGRALNQGARLARGEYLLLSNPDLVFLKDSIFFMIKKLESDQSVGIIGPQFLDSNRKIQDVGSEMPFLPGAIFSFSFLNKLFPKNLYSKKYFILDFDRKKEKEIAVLAGACILISKNVFNKVKGFDSRFFMYFEEADICYRVSMAGFKVLYYPVAKVIHLVGRSSDNKKLIEETFERSRYEFFKKYHGKLLGTVGEISIRIMNLPSKIFFFQ